MEASALTQAGRRGLLARRSPLLRLQGDDRLVALLRRGNDHAFEVIVDRYEARLLGFCRQMLGSTEDAEDVLQEVFVNAYRAMRADEREINLRPWLYRIARNRCLNHLRKPVPEGQDTMDTHPMADAASTHERVQNREEFRQLLVDVGKLPETQRSALLLREMDAMSYEEIAQAMDTTVPSVKSLLVRARIALAEASQARQLTCGEVRLDLAEAAEGLAKASGPVRRHLRDCDGCREFRDQLRSNSKVLAAIFPAGPLVLLKSAVLSKLGFGGAGASGSAGAAGAGGAGASGAALGGAGAGGIGAMGSAVGAKAVAGVVIAAVITAGAVEVKKKVSSPPPAAPTSDMVASPPRPPAVAPAVRVRAPAEPKPAPEPVVAEPAPDPEAPVAEETVAPTATPATTDEHDTAKHDGNGEADASANTTVSVAVTESDSTDSVTTGNIPPPTDTGQIVEPSPPPPPSDPPSGSSDPKDDPPPAEAPPPSP